MQNITEKINRFNVYIISTEEIWVVQRAFQDLRVLKWMTPYLTVSSRLQYSRMAIFTRSWSSWDIATVQNKIVEGRGICMNNRAANANSRAIGYGTLEYCNIRFVQIVVWPCSSVLYRHMKQTDTRKISWTIQLVPDQYVDLQGRYALSNERLDRAQSVTIKKVGQSNQGSLTPRFRT